MNKIKMLLASIVIGAASFGGYVANSGISGGNESLLLADVEALANSTTVCEEAPQGSWGSNWKIYGGAF